jgi:hypothetical protein
VIISISNLVILTVLQSTMVFFVDRVVNLFMSAGTRSTPTYIL